MSKNTQDALVKKVYQYSQREALFSKGDKIILGVSGGPDSVCLTHVMARLQQKYDLSVCLVHINYALRGEESDMDEQFVRQLAKQLSLPLEVARYHKKRFVRANQEEQLRDFRYDAFEQIRDRKQYDWVAVAHTRDDQAETVLMHLLRGAGLRGLGGIRAKRDRIIRPLLDCDRVEVLKFLRQGRLQYRTDTTNKDTSLLRNRIRLQLLPLLEKKYAAGTRQRLGTLARIMQQDYELIEQCGRQAYIQLRKKNRCGLSFNVVEYSGLHPAIRRMVFRLSVVDIAGTINGVVAAHWEEFEKIMHSEKSKSQVFSFLDLQIKRQGQRVMITRKQ